MKVWIQILVADAIRYLAFLQSVVFPLQMLPSITQILLDDRHERGTSTLLSTNIPSGLLIPPRGLSALLAQLGLQQCQSFEEGQPRKSISARKAKTSNRHFESNSMTFYINAWYRN